mmetsp:Transcript_20199/g.56362  ORF Transcript_20199/g.56362 Transcript_20199/m.56362 type:complete len:211 (-) Transcript_20199:148-780(-)
MAIRQLDAHHVGHELLSLRPGHLPNVDHFLQIRGQLHGSRGPRRRGVPHGGLHGVVHVHVVVTRGDERARGCADHSRRVRQRGASSSAKLSGQLLSPVCANSPCRYVPRLAPRRRLLPLLGAPRRRPARGAAVAIAAAAAAGSAAELAEGTELTCLRERHESLAPTRRAAPALVARVPLEKSRLAIIGANSLPARREAAVSGPPGASRPL